MFYLLVMKTNVIVGRLEDIKMSVGEFASQVGVAEVTMKENYFRGKRPSKSVALNMVRVLGMPASQFMYPEELEQIGLAPPEGANPQ